MGFLSKLFGRSRASSITSPFKPKVELQTEKGVKKYFSKISKLSLSDVYVEFANVRAAKHNLTFMPMGIGDVQRTQLLVTDLTDKCIVICMYLFGRERILGFNGGDLRSLNSLINDIDESVAHMNLEPAEHGKEVIQQLGNILGVRVS